MTREQATVALLREARELERRASAEVHVPPLPRRRGAKSAVTARAEHLRRHATGQAAADLERVAALRWEAVRLNDYHAVGAARRWNSPLPFADRLQEARLGLYDACVRFDPDRGFAFTTLAGWWLRARLSKTCGHTDHLPSYAQEIARNIGKLEALGVTGEEDVAEFLGTTAEVVRRIRGAALAPASLDAPGEFGAPMLELLAAATPAADEVVEERQQLARVGTALRALPDRERLVVVRWAEGATLGQIGGEVGRSRERVRQILVRALDGLRAAVASAHGEHA